MPLDDRDRKFERALGAHLRAACPDAETLASYHERSLSPDEMILWNKHIVGCAACQEVLSALEASGDVIAEGEREMELTAFGLSPEALRTAARTAVDATTSLTSIPHRPAIRVMPRRGGAWRWAAPAGAIAAGLLVFAVVTEMRHSASVLSPATQIATKTAPASPPTARSGSSRASAEAKEKEPANAPALDLKAPDAAHASRNTESAKAQPEAKSRILSQDELSKNGLESARNEIANDRLRASDESKDEDVRKKGAAGFNNGPAPQSVQQQMANQQKQARTAEAAAAPPPAPPATPWQEGERDDKALEAGPVAGASTGGQLQEVAPNRKAEYARAGNIASFPVVSSPNHQSLWRLGMNGTILYSSDQAAHWKSQTSGVSAELTSGSAPSAEVCWIVGKQGTILRTVTGGHEWLRVISPIPGDIGAIQASDALRARIWDTGRKVSFETADGGKTWNQVSGG